MDPPYLDYFGLKEKPFCDTPDPSFFFMSRSHAKALDYLRYFLRQKEAMAVVLGEVGVGKSITSRIFIESLEKEENNTALILNPVMDESEFLKELLRELKVDAEEKNSVRELLSLLEEFLLEEYKKGKNTICVIDEAQLLPDRTLDFIRVISNFETDKQKLIHIIFFAQKEFEERIMKENFRAIAQRITVKVNLEPLAKNEILSYINFRIYKSGAMGSINCDKSCVEPIYELTGGVPRLINLLCDRALLFLYLHSRNTIDGKVIRSIKNEESIRHLVKKEKITRARKPFIYSLIIAAIIYLLFKIGSFYQFVAIWEK